MRRNSSPGSRLAARIGLAERHRVLREAMAGLLERELGVDVVTASGWAEVVSLLESHDLDLLLLDQGISEARLAESLPGLLRLDPGVGVIVTGMGPADALRPLVISTGARGFLAKDLPPPELVAAVARELPAEARRAPR